MADMLSEEEQIELALKLSIDEAQRSNRQHPQLYEEYILPREIAIVERVLRTGTPPDADIYGIADTKLAPGKLLQTNTLDQFHQPSFGQSVEEFNSPASPCGLFVMAHSVLVPSLLAQMMSSCPGSDAADATCAAVTASEAHRLRLTEAGLKALLSERGGLRDVSVVLPKVREAMRWLRDQREAWVAGHAGDFSGEKERSSYLKAWVANFEISDWLQEKAAPGSAVHFVRYNQWPEVEAATHEERRRITEEERRFGGSRDARGRVQLAGGDVAFWVDSFRAEDVGAATLEGSSSKSERSVRTPAEWRTCRQTPAARQSLGPTFFAVDLNGHFVSCVACELQSKEDSTKFENTLLVLNTTQTNYLEWPALTRTYDLAFADEVSV